MDGHINVDTTGNLNVSHRRIFRVTGRNLNDSRLAQTAGSDNLLNFRMVVVETANETNLQLNASVLAELDALLDLLNISVQRLLAEYMLASLCSSLDQLNVSRGSGTNQNCLYLRQVDCFNRVLQNLRDTETCSPLLNTVVHERVSDCNYLCLRNRLNEIRAMQLTNTTATQDGNLYCFHNKFLSFKKDLFIKSEYLLTETLWSYLQRAG